MSAVASPFVITATSTPQPRLLIFSQRGQRVERWQCCGLELEDVITSIDDAEIVVPAHTASSRQRQQLVRLLSRALPASMLPRLGVSATPRHGKYDVLFAQVGNVGELLALNAVRGWRKRCGLAICYVQEIFVSYFTKLRQQLNFLNEFDLVFCGCAETVGPLSDRLGRQILHLPHGVDAIRFRPVRRFAERAIDITMIGRRSPVTHQALVDYAQRMNAFYFSDTTWSPRIWVDEPQNHRVLLANVIKNSRFFIANRANFDRLDKIASQDEIGSRYFEGMAGGAVILGDHPRTEAFDTYLGWPDSVIPIPVDCPNIGEIIDDLNAQPGRLEQASRRNVTEVLRRHDWYYRWKTILEIAGLPLREAAKGRAAELSGVAAMYEERPASSYCA